MAERLGTLTEIAEAITSTDVAKARIAEINTAAETKKEEVLDSIPEDYTELSDDVSELKEDLDEYCLCKNLVGTKANELYPCRVKTNDYVTFSSSDGSNIYCIISFYDENKNKIDYWSLDNKGSRTIHYDIADGYYVSVDRITKVPIQVEIGSVKTAYVPYFSSAKANSKRLDEIENHESLPFPVGNDIKNSFEVSADVFSGKIVNCGTKTEKLLFFSDAHPYYGSNNLHYDEFMSFAQKVAYKCGIDKIIDGGDWLQDGDTSTKATSKLLEIKGRCDLLFKHCYHALGNHDTNYQGTSGNKLSNNALTSILFEAYKNNYYTFKGDNTTFFVLDSGTDWETNISNYRKTQIDWLCSSLNSTTGNIAIVIHIWRNSNAIHPFANEISKIITAFENRAIYGIGENTYSFASASGYIKFVLTGHEHEDFSSVVGSTTIPVIGILNAINGDSFAIDSIIVDYDNNKLNCVRFGDGSDREFVI